jgi:hypothetical protein
VSINLVGREFVNTDVTASVASAIYGTPTHQIEGISNNTFDIQASAGSVSRAPLPVSVRNERRAFPTTQARALNLTNWVTYSEQLDQWILNADAVVSTNVATDPFGGNAVDEITHAIEAPARLLTLEAQQNFLVDANTDYNVSIFSKTPPVPDNATHASIRVTGLGLSTQAHYNMSNGVATLVQGQAFNVQATLENNGFYRCSHAVNSGSNVVLTVRYRVAVGPGLSDDRVNSDVAHTLHWFGMQVTRGDTISPYRQTGATIDTFEATIVGTSIPVDTNITASTAVMALSGNNAIISAPAAGKLYPLTGVSRIGSPNFGRDHAAAADDRRNIGLLDVSYCQGFDSGGHMDFPFTGYVQRTQVSQEILAGSPANEHYLFYYHNMMESNDPSGIGSSHNAYARSLWLDAVVGPNGSDGWAYDSSGVRKSFFVNQIGINITDQPQLKDGLRYPEYYADNEVQVKYLDVHANAGIPIGGPGGCNVSLDNFQAHANKTNVDWNFNGSANDTQDYYDQGDIRHTAQNIGVSSLNQAGGTAVCTTLAPHGLSDDAEARIIISGATPAAYNGTFNVADDALTRITDNTFSYSVPPATSSPAVGAIRSTVADRFSNPVIDATTFYSEWRNNYNAGRLRILSNNPGTNMVVLCNTNQWANDRDPAPVTSTYSGPVSGIPDILPEYQLAGNPSKSDVQGGFSEGNVGPGFPRSGVNQDGVGEGNGTWQKAYNSAYIATTSLRDPGIVLMSARIACLQAGTDVGDNRTVYPPEPDPSTPWNLVRWWFATTQIVGAHMAATGVRVGSTSTGRAQSVPIFDEYGLINGAQDYGLGTGNTGLTRKWMGRALEGPPTAATFTHATGEVWMREFENALCIVNTDNDEANSAVTIPVAQLPGGPTAWKRIQGDQDPIVNDGSDIVGDFTINPIDGIVLQRRPIFAPQLIKDLAEANSKPVADIFHPGHWAVQGGRTALKSEFLSDSKFVGVKLVHRWNWIEDATPGDYDWTDMDNRVAECEAASPQKRFAFIIQHGKFGLDPPNTPSYMWTDSSYGGGQFPTEPYYYGNIDRQPNQDGWRAYIENTKVRDAVNALTTAIVNRYGSNPLFETYNEGESSLENPDTGLMAAQQEIWLHSRDTLNAVGRYNIVNINFLHSEWPGTGQAGKAENAANWVVDNGMAIGAPDLKDQRQALIDGVYKVCRERYLEAPTSVDVQWENYDPEQNENNPPQQVAKDVREILAYGNNEEYGVITGGRENDGPKNWIHAWDSTREPWFSGSPTIPKVGPNVYTVVAADPVLNAEAYYESLGQGQYP